jgi:hypothetical protein
MHTMTDMSSFRLIQKTNSAVELYLEACHCHLINYSTMYGYSKICLVRKAHRKSRNSMVVSVIFNTLRAMSLQLAKVTRHRFLERIYMFLAEKSKIRMLTLPYIVCHWVSISCYTETFVWKSIEPKGKSIPQRIHFSAVAYNNDVIIYGGLEPEGGKVCNDLLKFNLINMKLEEVKTKNNPLSRYGHCMVITSSSQIDIFKAYMVGGMEQTFRPFDLYELVDGGMSE